MLKLSLCFPPSRALECLNFLGMAWQHAPALVVHTCIAGSEGSTLYCFRDRRCADCQRDLVVYEGKLMRENRLVPQ